MSEIPSVSEKYVGKVGEIPVGRGDYVTGGADGMPFLSFENTLKRRPIIAGEVRDVLAGYPEKAAAMFSGREKNPADWAVMWKETGADMIYIKFTGIDPAVGKTTAEDAVRIVKETDERTKLPIMVEGCGIPEIDTKVLTEVCSAVKGTKLIVARAEEEEYKKLSAAAMAGGHAVLAFSNLDINLAKQMNILLSDFGVERESIFMDPLMAPLGMGLDYSYSVNERIRLAALRGDRMLQVPMVCHCTEAWDVADATSEDPALGDVAHRATWWEAMTAICAMMSGADILIMRGPGAADMVRVYASELTEVV